MDKIMNEFTLVSKVLTYISVSLFAVALLIIYFY